MALGCRVADTLGAAAEIEWCLKELKLKLSVPPPPPHAPLHLRTDRAHTVHSRRLPPLSAIAAARVRCKPRAVRRCSQDMRLFVCQPPELNMVVASFDKDGNGSVSPPTHAASATLTALPSICPASVPRAHLSQRMMRSHQRSAMPHM